MSTPGRLKGESFERQREGSFMSTPGRPKGESFERRGEFVFLSALVWSVALVLRRAARREVE